MVNKDFFPALEDLEREKHIKKEVFIETLETALAIAYKKHTGTGKSIEVRLNPERNSIKIIAYQTVAEPVTNPEKEISLEDARAIKKSAKVGDVFAEDVVSKDFGRIASQTAKQVIMQKLREIEGAAAYAELEKKVNELVTCVIRRIDGQNVYIELLKYEAALMPQDQSSLDKYNVGDRIKVFVKSVRAGSRGPQITVTRSSAAFVRKLFELEVPEIANGLVEIRNIAREAGYRTKVSVVSLDENVDPVGACVGNRGMRVNAVVAEMGGEKVDIIPWSEDILEYIASALSPAKALMVQVNYDERTAKVIVPDDKLSLAIGKDGQNARLAAKLTSWKIDVKSHSASLQMEEFMETDEEETADADAEGEEKEKKEDYIFEEDLGDLE